MQRSRHRCVSVIAAATLFVLWGIAPLSAQLRIRSSVEVKRQTPREAGLLAQVGMAILPFRIAPSKVQIVTTVSGGQVRVEGAGAMLDLPVDTVLISFVDGSTMCLLPSRQEYFRLATAEPRLLEKFFKVDSRVRQRGPSDVLMGHPTERVSSTLQVTPVLPADGPDLVWDSRFQRNMDPAAIIETPEARQRRLATRDRVSREMEAQDPITIESWQSNTFGPLGLAAASASSSTLSIATAGLVPVAERRFALRQRIVNPTHGYRVDAVVTAVETVEVDDALFVIPAGYREIPTPVVKPQVR